MVCLRVYSSPVCGKAGETKGDGGDGSQLPMPLSEILQTDGDMHVAAHFIQLFQVHNSIFYRTQQQVRQRI